MRFLQRNKAVLFCLVATLAVACSPAPRRPLTSEEKTADLYWLYSQFKENYAPLAYKQQRYGFEYEALKARYLTEAASTRSNEEFYLLMHRFVAEFRDAHTGSSLLASSLPARTQVAYLGFDGKRKGKALKVTRLLPTISADSVFPIKVDDEITHVGGVPITDVIRQELVPVRNLGQEESNLTGMMPVYFNRTSLALPMPVQEQIVLTVKRGDKELKFTLPWIIKDLYSFTREQAEAARQGQEKSAPKKSEFTALGSSPDLSSELFFKVAFQGVNGEISLIPEVARKALRGMGNFHFWNTFVYIDTLPSWSSKILTDTVADAAGVGATPMEEMKQERNLPANAIVLDAGATYPTYITPEKVLDQNGKETAQVKYVATMYVNTFSPQKAEDKVLAEVKATLATLKAFGVKSLIIDLINNGGGSLRLGNQMAQLLSREKIYLPEMQFKVSESWLDEFEQTSLNGSSDAEKELARRVFSDLRNDLAQNRALSARYSPEVLFPFETMPNTDLDENFQIVLMVNEMCASMCDIFTAALKDNGMATIIGAKTMGAGGNVVIHGMAPNSHLLVNQTESLVLRKDGSYIENNGVEPDIALSVNEEIGNKYDSVRKKAIEVFMKSGAKL